MNLAAFRQVLDSMENCSSCDGRQELVEAGTSSGSPSYISLQCSTCDSKRNFWSVGDHSRGKFSIGISEIPKRNSIVYSSVMAGRLIGIVWHKLFLYHSMLNIPGPITSRNFRIVQANNLLAAEATAIVSMSNARDQLRSVMNTDLTMSPPFRGAEPLINYTRGRGPI